MSEHWLDLLTQFFEAQSHALGEVFDAASCREGWLHGELFRQFRFRQGFNSFKVNSLKIGKGKTADFSAENPKVVGEIKLLGWDYQTKCITGGGIKPFLKRVDFPITTEDRDLVMDKWGLIADFFRLLDFADREERDAYLVLIVDERKQEAKDLTLARALRGINFIEPSRDIRFPAGVVRLWSVPAEPPRRQVSRI